MIDFGKLSAQLHKGKIINPTEIFMSLPEKSAKYAYLRNVQAEVLDQWFLQRDRKDNIIKMNTGSGKTTVALLILKSCLNVFDKYASPAGNFRVINGEKLLLLKTKLQDFCKAIATDGSFKDLQQLTQLLNAFSLTPEKFFACYSVSFVKEQ